jgi:hypothetical protein
VGDTGRLRISYALLHQMLGEWCKGFRKKEARDNINILPDPSLNGPPSGMGDVQC